MNTTLRDEKAYHAQQQQVDAAVLAYLADGGKSHYEIMAMLRAKGIGDAKSDEKLELSYSSTGAIWRAAKTSLWRRRLLHDSWDRKERGKMMHYPGDRPARVA